MFIFEHFFDVYIPSLIREAERLAKIKTLSVSLALLNGARKITQTYFFALMWSMVFTATSFSIVLYGVMSYANTGVFRMDGFLWFALVVWILSFAITTSYLSEKRWLKAFDIQHKLDSIAALQREPKFTVPHTTPRSETFNEQAVAKILDRLLEEKFLKYAEKMPIINPPPPIKKEDPVSSVLH